MTALILIDFQQGFDHPSHWGGPRGNPAAEDNAAALLRAWRGAGLPVIHVLHDSTDPGSVLRLDALGGAPKPEVAPLPGEPVLPKRVNAAFIGTDLDGTLRRLDARQVLICGLTTDHCVSTSTRMAANLGYDVTLASDACATFPRPGSDGTVHPADLVHELALASLRGEFAAIRDTAEIIGDIQ